MTTTPTTNEAILAAYAAGWRDRHAVGCAVAAGDIEGTEADLASPTPIGTEDLHLRIGRGR